MKSFVVSVLLCLPSAATAVPSAVTFQGRLLDALGSPVEDPSTVDIALFSAPLNGVQLWSGSTSVDPVNGYFSVTLGAPPMTPIDSAVLSTPEAWVQVSLGGLAMDRVPLNSTPFALVAQEVDYEVVQHDDTRLTWSAPITPQGQACTTPGTWCNFGDNWGVNRLGDKGVYTLDDDYSMSDHYVDLALTDNQHRTVMMSHLDWGNTGAYDVYLSFDGGGSFSFHKRVGTKRTLNQTPYTSQIRVLATNLPLNQDVVVRVQGAYRRMHLDGFALSRSLYPEQADGTACPVGTVGVTGFCIEPETTASFGVLWTTAQDHCTGRGLRLCGHEEMLAGLRHGAVRKYLWSERDAWYVTADLSENSPGAAGFNQTCDIQGNLDQPSHPEYSTQCNHDMQTGASWRTVVCCY